VSTTTDDKALELRARFLLRRIANRLDFFAVAQPLGVDGPTVAPSIPFLTREPAERFERGEATGEDQDVSSKARKEGRLALVLGHVAGDKAPPVFLAVKRKDGALTTAGPSHYRVGFYARDAASMSRWTCFCFDGESAEALAELAHERIGGVGLPCFLERAKSGRSYHVWIFYEEKKPARLARELGLKILLGDGVSLGAGVSVLPRTGKGELGPSVFAPWFHGAPEGTNVFVKRVGLHLEERDPWTP
jgi:hypothetical protein